MGFVCVCVFFFLIGKSLLLVHYIIFKPRGEKSGTHSSGNLTVPAGRDPAAPPETSDTLEPSTLHPVFSRAARVATQATPTGETFKTMAAVLHPAFLGRGAGNGREGISEKALLSREK